MANVVNRFTLNINRSEVSTSGLDYNGVSNGTELAAVLNTVSGIEVIYNGGNNKIVIAASTAGAITFSNVLLASVPELGGSAGSLDFYENGPPLVVDDALWSGPSGSESYILTSAMVWLNTYSDDDMLNFISTSGISGTYDGTSGVLNLSGNATRSEYLSVLRTVTYDNLSHMPMEGAREVSFLVTDTDHSSAVFTRGVNLIASPFPWPLFLPKSPIQKEM